MRGTRCTVVQGATGRGRRPDGVVEQIDPVHKDEITPEIISSLWTGNDYDNNSSCCVQVNDTLDYIGSGTTWIDSTMNVHAVRRARRKKY